DQCMPGLDCHVPAEPVAKHEHGPKPQRAANRAASTTPTHRTASPSITQNSFRSVYAARNPFSSPITERAAMTHRLLRSSLTPGLRFPPAKNAAHACTKNTTVSAISAGCEKKAPKP